MFSWVSWLQLNFLLMSVTLIIFFSRAYALNRCEKATLIFLINVNYIKLYFHACKLQLPAASWHEYDEILWYDMQKSTTFHYTFYIQNNCFAACQLMAAADYDYDTVAAAVRLSDCQTG